MTMIPPVSSTPSSTSDVSSTTASTNNTTDGSSTNSLDQLANTQEFLQLLVAELKYQDPDNPVDPTEFMSQTAQLTEVQAINGLQSQLTQQLSSEQTLASTSLIGKQVTAQVNGQTVAGTVSDVDLSGSGGPMLDVSGTQVALSAVTDVGTPPSTQSAAPAGPSDGTSTGTT